MIELLLILAPIFLAGLYRGSGVCTAICAPGLFPLIAAHKRSAWSGLKLGIIFNLPRILILAGAGAVVGYVSFTLLTGTTWFRAFAIGFGQLSYFLFGVVMTIVGAVMYARTDERRVLLSKALENGRAGALPCETVSHSHRKYSFWFQRFVPAARTQREQLLVLTWGALLGTACFAEISVLTLELPAFAGIMAAFGPNNITAALYGALAMAVFATGSAVPILFIAAAAGQLSKKIDTEQRVIVLRMIGAVAMVIVGLVLVFTSLRFAVG